MFSMTAEVGHAYSGLSFAGVAALGVSTPRLRLCLLHLRQPDVDLHRGFVPARAHLPDTVHGTARCPSLRNAGMA